MDNSSSPTCAEIVRAYLTWAERVGRYSSAESWTERKRVLGWFEEAFGRRQVVDVRPHELIDWILAHPEWLSTSTMRGKFNIVNRVMNWAAKGRRIDYNPFDNCDRFEEAPPRPCLKDDELDCLCHGTDKEYAILLRFIRASGFRLSEVSDMQWPDVDLENGRVTIRKDKGNALKKIRKAKVRTLNSAAWEILKFLRAADPLAEGFVFLNRRGGPLNRRSVGSRLRRLKARLKATFSGTCHGLRHQWGTTAVKNGAALKGVSLALGHSTTAITEKFYVHLDDDVDFVRAAAELAKAK